MKANALKKVMRDLLSEKKRTLTVLIAIIVGVFAVAMLSTSKSILNKNLKRNYLETNPASFTFILDSLSHDLKEELIQTGLIEDIEVRQKIWARLTDDNGEKVPVLLFLVEDFSKMRINKFYLEEGNLPDKAQGALIERQGRKISNVSIGKSYSLQLPKYQNIEVDLQGFSHDPGVAPSWMEGNLYMYLSMNALPQSYWQNKKVEAKLIVKENKLNKSHIEDCVKNLKSVLLKKGIKIYRSEILEPGVHMHQTQMNALMFLVLLFGILALFLSTFLVVNMISAVMAKEVRQIAIMKAIGAKNFQIASIYLVSISLLSLIGVIVGAPLGIIVGRIFAKFNAEMLNFTLFDVSLDFNVIAFIVSIGILLPILVSFLPIYIASKVSINKSLNDVGVSDSYSRSNRTAKRFFALFSKSRIFLFAVRNTFRRKSRLALTLISLSLGGAIFMTSFNIRSSTSEAVDSNFDSQPQDLMLISDEYVKQSEITEAIANIKEINRYELGNSNNGRFIMKNDLDSKAIDIKSMPFNCNLYRPELTEGRWFEIGKNEVVINSFFQTEYPNIKVGDSLQLKIDNNVVTYSIVGACNQVFVPSRIYIENDKYSQHLGKNDQLANLMLVELKPQYKKDVEKVSLRIEDALKSSGISIISNISKEKYKTLVVEHLAIIVAMLISMTFLVVIVGGLGMATSVGINISERKREIGILQAIGLDKMGLSKILITESIVTGIISLIIAAELSIPLSAYLGNQFFKMFFESNLIFKFSYVGLFLWLFIVLIICSIASYIPARRVSKKQPVLALNYE